MKNVLVNCFLCRKEFIIRYCRLVLRKSGFIDWSRFWLGGGKMSKIRDCEIVLSLCPEEFEMSMGRKSKDQEEIYERARLADKGLLNGYIDWDLLYECTCDARVHK